MIVTRQLRVVPPVEPERVETWGDVLASVACHVEAVADTGDPDPLLLHLGCLIDEYGHLPLPGQQ